MSDLNQTLPPDTGDKLANVELMAEKTLTDLEDKESEHKTAKNVRYEFQARNTFMFSRLINNVKVSFDLFAND